MNRTGRPNLDTRFTDRESPDFAGHRIDSARLGPAAAAVFGTREIQIGGRTMAVLTGLAWFRRRTVGRQTLVQPDDIVIGWETWVWVILEVQLLRKVAGCFKLGESAWG